MIRQSRQGMTLVELVMVVALLIILAGVSMPVFNTVITQRRLTGAVQRVANDLRYVRSQAVTQGGIQRLHSGDEGGEQPGQYRLEQSPTGSNPWTPFTPWYSIGTDFTGATIASIKDATNNTLYGVSFDPQGGSANTGASFPISISITTPAGTRTIQVMRTGNIVVP